MNPALQAAHIGSDIEAVAAAQVLSGADQGLRVEVLGQDKSFDTEQFSRDKWERLSRQRDTLIKAVIQVFILLNGGVFALVLLAWLVGHFSSYRIVDGNTLLALIGATVAQAGLAFAAIVKFLFPSQGKSDQTKPASDP